MTAKEGHKRLLADRAAALGTPIKLIAHTAHSCSCPAERLEFGKVALLWVFQVAHVPSFL